MQPLVVGSPNVRFFATAPLRTADGFNVGAYVTFFFYLDDLRPRAYTRESSCFCSLCIMDDHPRSEFTPRQRHTLKEFATIVMREMELWRDKIQLRIRERIQTSMEQFTRECLEIDNEAEQQGASGGIGTAHPPPTPTRNSDEVVHRQWDGTASVSGSPSADLSTTSPGKGPLTNAVATPSRVPSPVPGSQQQQNQQHQPLRALSSMERVYERAARLVKRTLDVEGAVVMDVSTFDVLETTKAEGALSIVCHHAECAPAVSASSMNPSPGASSTASGSVSGTTCEIVHTGPTTHTVSPEERPLFMEFFAKHPEGKIAEGIVPRAFRALLPTRVQHALSAYTFSRFVDSSISPSPLLLQGAALLTSHILDFFPLCLVVPIFNIDKRPFALLCAYNTADHVKPFVSVDFYIGLSFTALITDV